MPPSSHKPTNRRLGPLGRVDPRVAIGSVALVLAVLFVALNDERVRIHFVFFTVSSHLWIGFLTALVLGAVLGQLLSSKLGRRRRR